MGSMRRDSKARVIDSMKRAMPWGDGNEVILSSDDDDDNDSSSSSSDADMGVKDGSDEEITPAIKALDVHPTKHLTPEEIVARRAEMYQEYMKKIPIPSLHGSAIPFTTWQGLAKSIKQLYGQPLHYLTNNLLKQWDKSRMGSDDEHLPLDSIIHPRKAEATIWLMEEAHRLTSSHQHLAQLWLSDPMHHAFIDAIFPQI